MPVYRKSPPLQGWGLLSQFSPFRYFPHFPLLSKQMLAIEYHVYIWQVSPQLSCGDTCQIWMWFRESNSYFCKIENLAYGEISERSFSNPHPWTSHKPCYRGLGFHNRTHFILYTTSIHMRKFSDITFVFLSTNYLLITVSVLRWCWKHVYHYTKLMSYHNCLFCFTFLEPFNWHQEK